jgi:hypothetical protein
MTFAKKAGISALLARHVLPLACRKWRFEGGRSRRATGPAHTKACATAPHIAQEPAR